MTRQIFRYHPTFGYQFIPGLSARVQHEGGGYLMRTNEAGFRCRHEFSPRRTSDRFRILLFGDSYTAGDGVSDGRRYADLLEEMVPGVEVFNYGLPGSGTDQQYLIWRELAADVEHDLVICAVLVENIRRVNARYRLTRNFSKEHETLAKPYFSRNYQGDLTLHHVPVPKAAMPASGEDAPNAADVDEGGRFVGLRRLVNKLGPGVKSVLQRVTRYDPVPGYTRPDNPDWLLMEAILRRWIKEVPGPFMLFPLPLHQHVEDTADADGYQTRFRSLVAPPRVTLHDPLPALRAYPMPARRAFRFEHDVHPTVTAHRVLARTLADRIAPMVQAARPDQDAAS